MTITKIGVELTTTDGCNGYAYVTRAKDGELTTTEMAWSDQMEGHTESVSFSTFDATGKIIDSETYDGDVWRDLQGFYDEQKFYTNVFNGMSFDEAVGSMEHELFTAGEIGDPHYPDGYTAPDGSTLSM